MVVNRNEVAVAVGVGKREQVAQENEMKWHRLGGACPFYTFSWP